MKADFLFRRRTRQATTVALLLFAIATMWAAHRPGLVFWAEKANWIAMGYLLAGMVLLMFRRTRLMFVCLGCSAAISLFFLEIQNKRMQAFPAPKPTQTEMSDSNCHELSTPYQ